MTMAGLPAEPGWYRLAGHDWEPVDPARAEAEIARGEGWDLVHVKTTADVEVPLF